MSNRPHRRVNNTDVNDVGEERTYARKNVDVYQSTPLFDGAKIGAPQLSVEVDSLEDEVPDSLTSLISIPLLDENASVTINYIGEDLSWKEDATPEELFSLLNELFPDFADRYVIGRDMQARGYHVREDGAAIIVNSERVNNPSPSEITYYVTESNDQDSIKKQLREIAKLRMKLDETYPYEYDGFRIFTIGVISNNAQLYGLRVQYLPITDKFRLHRMNYSPNSQKVADLWKQAKKDPKYRRKALTSVEFSIKDVYP